MKYSVKKIFLKLGHYTDDIRILILYMRTLGFMVFFSYCGCLRGCLMKRRWFIFIEFSTFLMQYPPILHPLGIIANSQNYIIEHKLWRAMRFVLIKCFLSNCTIHILHYIFSHISGGVELIILYGTTTQKGGKCHNSLPPSIMLWQKVVSHKKRKESYKRYQV